MAALFSCQENNNLSLHIIEENGKYGFIDSLGNTVIKPSYLFVDDFSEGLALVVVDTFLIKNSYDYSECKSRFDSLLVRRKTESDSSIIFRYGYINKKNKFIIDPTYEFEVAYLPDFKESVKNREIKLFDCSFSNNRALFQDKISKKYGYLEKRGNIAIQATYEDGSNFSEGLAAVNFGKDTLSIDTSKEYFKKWGYINNMGKVIIEKKYSFASNFNEGLAVVSFCDLDRDEETLDLGFSMNQIVINKRGLIVAGPFSSLGERVWGHNDGFIIVQRGLPQVVIGYRFIDTKGDYTTDFDLSRVTIFNEGYAGVETTDSNWVFINKKFEIVSESFEDLYPFSSGMARVKRDGKWGYINKKFEIAIPCKYNSCGYFKNNLAKFTLRHGALVISGYINIEGEVVYQKEEYSFRD